MSLSPSRCTVLLPTGVIEGRVQPRQLQYQNARSPSPGAHGSPRRYADREALSAAAPGSSTQSVKYLMRYVQSKNAETRYDLPNEKFFTGREIVNEVKAGASRCMACVEDKVWMGAKDGSIQVLDLKTGDIVERIHRIAKSFVTSIMCVGLNVWVGYSDGFLRVYEPEKLNVTKICKEHNGCINQIAVSFNGVTVYTAGADFTINIWDATTVERIGLLAGHKGAVRCMTFAFGVRLFSAGDDGCIIEWDLYRLKPIYILKNHHKGSVRCLASTSNHLWSGGEDGTVRIWSLFNNEMLSDFTPAYRSRNSIKNESTFAVADSGAAAALAPAATETFCETSSQPQCVHVIGNPHTTTVSNIIAVGATVWSVCLSTVFVWDATDFRLESQFKEHNDFITCINPVHQSLVARVWSSGNDGLVKMWNSESQWMSAFKAAESEHQKMLEELLDQGVKRENTLERQLDDANTRIQALKKELELMKKEHSMAFDDNESLKRLREELNATQGFDIGSISDPLERQLRILVHRVCESDRDCQDFLKRGGLDYSKLDDSKNFENKRGDANKHPFADPVFDHESYGALVEALKAIKDRYGSDSMDFLSGRDEVLMRWKRGDDSFGNCTTGMKRAILADASQFPCTKTSVAAAQDNLLRMELLSTHAQIEDLLSNTAASCLDEANFDMKKLKLPDAPEDIYLHIPNGTWVINAEQMTDADMAVLIPIKKRALRAVAGAFKNEPVNIRSSRVQIHDNDVKNTQDDKKKNNMDNESEDEEESFDLEANCVSYPACFLIEYPSANNQKFNAKKCRQVCGMIPVTPGMSTADRGALVMLRQKYGPLVDILGVPKGGEEGRDVCRGWPFLHWRKKPQLDVHLINVKMLDESTSNYTLGFLTVEELSTADLRSLRKVVSASEKRTKDCLDFELAVVDMAPMPTPSCTPYVAMLEMVVNKAVPVGLTIPCFNTLTPQELIVVYGIYKKYRGDEAHLLNPQDSTGLKAPTSNDERFRQSLILKTGVQWSLDNIRASAESALGSLFLSQQASRELINRLTEELANAQAIIDKSPVLTHFLSQAGNASKELSMGDAGTANKDAMPTQECKTSAATSVTPYGSITGPADAIFDRLKRNGKSLTERLADIADTAKTSQSSQDESKDVILAYITCTKAIHDICSRGSLKLTKKGKEAVVGGGDLDVSRAQLMRDANDTSDDTNMAELQQLSKILFKQLHTLTDADSKQLRRFEEDVHYSLFYGDQALDSDSEMFDSQSDVDIADKFNLSSQDLAFVKSAGDKALLQFHIVIFEAAKIQATKGADVAGPLKKNSGLALKSTLNIAGAAADGVRPLGTVPGKDDASKKLSREELIAKIPRSPAGLPKSRLEYAIVDAARLAAAAVLACQRIFEQNKQIMQLENALDKARRKSRSTAGGAATVMNNDNSALIIELERQIAELRTEKQASIDQETRNQELLELLDKERAKLREMYRQWERRNYLSDRKFGDVDAANLADDPSIAVPNSQKLKIEYMQEILERSSFLVEGGGERKPRSLSNPYDFLYHYPIPNVPLQAILDTLLKDAAFKRHDKEREVLLHQKRRGEGNDTLDAQIENYEDMMNEISKEIALAYHRNRLKHATEDVEKALSSGTPDVEYKRENLNKVKCAMTRYEEQAKLFDNFDKEAIMKDNTILKEDLKEAHWKMKLFETEVTNLRQQLNALSSTFEKWSPASTDRTQSGSTSRGATGIAKEPLTTRDEEAVPLLEYARAELKVLRMRKSLDEFESARGVEAAGVRTQPRMPPAATAEVKEELRDQANNLEEDAVMQQPIDEAAERVLDELFATQIALLKKREAFLLDRLNQLGDTKAIEALAAGDYPDKRLSLPRARYGISATSVKDVTEVEGQRTGTPHSLRAADNIQELRDLIEKLKEDINRMQEELDGANNETEGLRRQLAEAGKHSPRRVDEVSRTGMSQQQEPQVTGGGEGADEIKRLNDIINDLMRELQERDETIKELMNRLENVPPSDDAVKEDEKPLQFIVISTNQEMLLFDKDEFKRDFAKVIDRRLEDLKVLHTYHDPANVCVCFNNMPYSQERRELKNLMKNYENDPDKYECLLVTGMRRGELENLIVRDETSGGVQGQGDKSVSRQSEREEKSGEVQGQGDKSVSRQSEREEKSGVQEQSSKNVSWKSQGEEHASSAVAPAAGAATNAEVERNFAHLMRRLKAAEAAAAAARSAYEKAKAENDEMHEQFDAQKNSIDKQATLIDELKRRLARRGMVPHDEQKYADGRDAELKRLNQLVTQLEDDIKNAKMVRETGEGSLLDAQAQQMERDLMGSGGACGGGVDVVRRIVEKYADNPIVQNAVAEIVKHYEDREKRWNELANVKKQMDLNNAQVLAQNVDITRRLGNFAYLYETRPILIRAVFELYRVVIGALKVHAKHRNEVATKPLSRNEAISRNDEIAQRVDAARDGIRWILANLFTIWELHHIGASPNHFPPDARRPTWRDIYIPERYVDMMNRYSAEEGLADGETLRSYGSTFHGAHMPIVENFPLFKDDYVNIPQRQAEDARINIVNNNSSRGSASPSPMAGREAGVRNTMRVPPSPPTLFDISA